MTAAFLLRAIFGLSLFSAACQGAEPYTARKNAQGQITEIIFDGDPAWLAEQQDPKSHFHKLRNLRRLTLHRHRLTEAEMKYVVGLRNVTALDVGSATWGLPDEGVEIESVRLALLAKMTWLEELELSLVRKRDGSEDFSGVVYVDWSFLPALKRLKSIRLSSNHPVNDDFCKQIAANHDVEEIESWAEDTLTDEGLAQLASLAKLKILRLHSKRITDRGVQDLAGLTKIEEFFTGGELTEKSLDVILQWPQLRQVGLRLDRLSPAHMKRICQLPRLERLRLDVPCSDDEVAQLRGHPTLTEIDLPRATVSERSLPILRSIPKLRYAMLSGDSGDPVSKKVAATVNAEIEARKQHLMWKERAQ